MNRRKFIQNIGISSIPMMIGGIKAFSYASGPMLQSLYQSVELNDNILVIIQLFGGNDGLNTVLPLNQYAALSALRPNILIPENKALSLYDEPNTGLHPAFEKLNNLYSEDKVKIIQSVGYPNPDYSHFRSSDIWNTASDSNEFWTSGWLGRYFEDAYPNYPQDYPNSDMPDPIALQLGSISNPIFQGNAFNFGTGINTSLSFNTLKHEFNSPMPNTYYGSNLRFLNNMYRLYENHAISIKTASDKVKNAVSYPNQNGWQPLSEQLKVIARLIAGGLKTKVYLASIGGFDTHSNQVDASDHTKGDHTTLLTNLSEAISAFQKDIELLGVADRVIGVTTSEFGRRIISNASVGTDHGTAAPAFLFGKNVVGGLLGNNPQLSPTMKVEDNLPMQYDFRSIYATLLHDWFCVGKPEDYLNKTFQLLPLVNNGCNRSADDRELKEKQQKEWITAYPNPFVEATQLKFNTEGGRTNLQVYNNRGELVQSLLSEDNHPSGQFEVRCDLGSLPAGFYYARLQNGNVQKVITLSKVQG